MSVMGEAYRRALARELGEDESPVVKKKVWFRPSNEEKKPVSKANGTSDWDRRDLPQFPNTKVLVLPGAFYGSCVALFAECGMTMAETVEDADIVAFIGGSDINPELYGQKALPQTSFSQARDDYETAIYHKAIEHRKVMFGICRGAQFLHAMHGGKLWQHVENHGGRSHMIVDIEEDCRVEATSVHHQMLQDNEGLTVVAVCEEQVSKYFEDEDTLTRLDDTRHIMEIEAGCYTDTRSFFVQGHPEIGTKEYRSWCMTKLHEFYFDWVGVSSFPGEEQVELEQAIINLLY